MFKPFNENFKRRKKKSVKGNVNARENAEVGEDVRFASRQQNFNIYINSFKKRFLLSFYTIFKAFHRNVWKRNTEIFWVKKN